MRDALKYPEIVRSKIRIMNYDDGRQVEGKSPIENPTAMGIDRIIEAALKDYEGTKQQKKDTFRKGHVKDTAEEVLIEFESDPCVIRERQFTMQYFFDNDALREFVRTTETPTDSWHDFDIRNLQKMAYNHFQKQKIFVEYLRGLEKVITNPTSEIMRNVKGFLERTIEKELPALEDQVAEAEDYTIVLRIPKSGIWSTSFFAVDSKGNRLNLKKFLTDKVLNTWMVEGIVPFFLNYAKEKEKKFDYVEVTVKGCQDLKIETVTKRTFRGPKRKEHLTDEFDHKKVLQQLVGSFVMELTKSETDEEKHLYSNLSGGFDRFWTQLKYYAHMADYFHKLQENGFPLTTPDIAPMEKNVMEVKDGHSLNLLRNMNKEDIVPNDINFGEEDAHIYLVTGPNKNGKTTFLNMAMSFQAAFQAGWFLPATYARISPKAGIKSFYTEIVTEDDAESRFSYDAKRLKDLFARIRDYNLVPMDEPVTSTNADFIQTYLQEVIRDVLPHAPHVTFVITSHEHSLIDVVEQLECAQNLKCVTEEQDGRLVRTYKIFPGFSTVSNADDLMEEYGANPESLIGYMKQSAEEGKLTFEP